SAPPIPVEYTPPWCPARRQSCCAPWSSARDAQLGEGGDVGADDATPPACHAVLVGRDGDTGVGPVREHPRREPSGRALRLALLGRHRDDEPPVGTVHHVNE